MGAKTIRPAFAFEPFHDLEEDVRQSLVRVGANPNRPAGAGIPPPPALHGLRSGGAHLGGARPVTRRQGATVTGGLVPACV